MELVLPAGGRFFEGAGAEHGNAPHRPPFWVWTLEDPAQEAAALPGTAHVPGPQALCGVSPVRAHASEAVPAAWTHAPEQSQPAAPTPQSSPTSRSPGPSLFRPHCLRLCDNSGFLRGDPGFGFSPSCPHGNAGSWLISIFNLVPSSECPASPRHPAQVC